MQLEYYDYNNNLIKSEKCDLDDEAGIIDSPVA